MTDRIKGYIVTLEKDIREDDAENILNAIRMIKGVLTIQPSVVKANDFMIRGRIKHAYFDKIHKIFFPEKEE